MADVAMGEPAGSCHPEAPEAAGASASTRAAESGAGEGAAEKKSAKEAKPIEWYGFIRLVVWALPSTDLGGRCCAGAVTAVVPAGSKESGAKELPPYAMGRSTDKGAVAAIFPSARLIVVSLHLHGTNK